MVFNLFVTACQSNNWYAFAANIAMKNSVTPACYKKTFIDFVHVNIATMIGLKLCTVLVKTVHF